MFLLIRCLDSNEDKQKQISLANFPSLLKSDIKHGPKICSINHYLIITYYQHTYQKPIINKFISLCLH